MEGVSEEALSSAGGLPSTQRPTQLPVGLLWFMSESHKVLVEPKEDLLVFFSPQTSSLYLLGSLQIPGLCRVQGWFGAGPQESTVHSVQPPDSDSLDRVTLRPELRLTAVQEST